MASPMESAAETKKGPRIGDERNTASRIVASSSFFECERGWPLLRRRAKSERSERSRWRAVARDDRRIGAPLVPSKSDDPLPNRVAIGVRADEDPLRTAIGRARGHR